MTNQWSNPHYRSVNSDDKHQWSIPHYKCVNSNDKPVIQHSLIIDVLIVMTKPVIQPSL